MTGVLVAVWYAMSVVCNQTSKRLLRMGDVGTSVLTLAQLILATACGGAFIFGLRVEPHDAIKSRAQLADMAVLAAVFSAGFGLLNSALTSMHVSLVMTLRAAEPLTTLALGAALLPASERVSAAKAAALLPVVAGCAMSAAGAHGPSARALVVVSLCNVCFSLRGILGKRVSTTHGTRPLSAFYQLCGIGALLQGLLMLGRAAALGAPLPPLPPAHCLPTLMLNGFSFYAYLQLSWVVLGRVSAVTHSLLNSLRRPATIAAALLVAPAPLSPLNLAGIGVACVSALVYGLL